MKQLSLSRIQYLMSLPPEALIRVYSYQGQKAWDAAEARGYWTGPSDALGNDDHTREFRVAYDWMREKMAERVPNYSGDYPMWAWLKRPSTKPKLARYMGTSGTIRLTALIPRSRILFSNYDTYHSVLNVNWLALTDDDDDHMLWMGDRYLADGRINPELIECMKPSWDRCLDFRFPLNQEEIDYSGCIDYFRAQACIDRIYPHEIVSVRRFEKKEKRK
jgi:hypothetical protein